MLIAVFKKSAPLLKVLHCACLISWCFFSLLQQTKQQTVSLSIDSVFLKRQGVPVKLIKYRRSFMKLCW